MSIEQVSLLTIINGEGGEKKGEKIVKSVFDAIIDSKIKHIFTWTGKSSDGKTKIAFPGYKEIIGLICSVIRRADQNYTLKGCEHDLIYKVLKYGCVKPLNSQTASTSASQNLVSVMTTSQPEIDSKQLIDLLLPILTAKNK